VHAGSVASGPSQVRGAAGHRSPRLASLLLIYDSIQSCTRGPGCRHLVWRVSMRDGLLVLDLCAAVVISRRLLRPAFCPLPSRARATLAGAVMATVMRAHVSPCVARCGVFGCG
jgi:hypothetical protein